MNKFVRNLLTEWRRLDLPVSASTAVVAVSGGADSSALLFAMCDLIKRRKLDIRLIAAHFNHGFRGEDAFSDQRFTAELAKRLNVGFAAGTAAIQTRGNLEQNAREARYAFLARTASEFSADLIVTGHTVNDQAETFLLNLIRGSGPDGLAAMKPVRSMFAEDASACVGLRLARPLLRWAKRLDTEQYCRDAEIRYRSDAMNDDTKFSRVRVRKVIIPVLEQLNPKAVDALASAARLIQELNTTAAVGSSADETLAVAELKTLAKPELYRVLRSWLRFRRGDLRGLELKHIAAIECLIHSRKSGRTAELPRRQQIVKQGGRLVFTELAVEK